MLASVADEREVVFKIGDSFTKTFLVDSGSLKNVMCEDTFKQILECTPDAIYDLCFAVTTGLTAYGGQKLNVKCTFKAWVEVIGADKPRMLAEFVVVGDGTQNLMGYETSKKMRVAKVGLTVNRIIDEENIELSTPHLSKIDLECGSQRKNEFPKIPGVRLDFEIKSNIEPVKCARRNIPLSMQKHVNERLTKMLELGILEKAPKASRWISPMHIVPKANGDTRIVIDMRQPNRAIERYNHSMPLIEELWDKFQGAQHFTKIDLKDAFHHVEIGEESRELTTFMSDLGMLRYTRLAFGVCCAPELFQREMERILEDFRDFCVVFMDDILVFGKNEVELLERQTLIEKALMENNLTINEAKTVRNRKETEFLGFLIKDGSISPAISKTEAIEKFQIPQTIKDLRSFLGMVNHLQSFIPNLAEKTEPLRSILRKRKGNAFWGKEQSEAFSSLKVEIGKHLSPRKIFDVSKETLIYTDASPYALGAVLVQRTGKINNGSKEEKMIACASKTLTDVERRYSQTQREALAAVWGVERFFYYLMGRRFTLKTDANALQFIYKTSPQETKRVLNRADGWALRLEPYNFDVEYVKGEHNIADPFSRLFAQSTDPTPFENDYEPHILCFVSPDIEDLEELLVKYNISAYDMIHFSKRCDEIRALKYALQTNIWDQQIEGYKAFADEYLFSDKVLWRSGRLVIPTALRKNLVEYSHKCHATYSCMISLLSECFWWPSMSQDIITCISNCYFCKKYGSIRDLDLNDNVLFINSSKSSESVITTNEILESQQKDNEIRVIRKMLEDKDMTIKTEYNKYLDNMYMSNDLIMFQEQFIIPKGLRIRVMDAAHIGHPSKHIMSNLISRHLWWPDLSKDVERYIKCCESCTRMRRPEPPEPISSTKLPSEPWKNIAIDFFSAPIDLKSKILVLKDFYSRYLITKLVSTENSEETTDALDSVFEIFGKPLTIKSDNGPPFQSATFKSWCERKGIVHIHSTPLSPRQNGLVERAMQGIKKALTAAKIEKKNLTEALKEYVEAYNSWPHAVTLIPPSDLMFARAFRGNFPMSQQAEVIDATQDDIQERDRISKLKSKLYQDRVLQAKLSVINISDEVYILKKGETKLSPRFGDTKFKVLAKNGSQLTLQSPSGNIILRSVEHVTKSVTNKDIEEYHNMKKTACVPQKGIYEENQPILVQSNLEIGTPKEILKKKKDFLNFVCSFFRRKGIWRRNG